MKLNLSLLCVGWFFALAAAHATVPSQYADQPEEWFRSSEGRRIADNVMTWQSPRGSWPKNRDTASQPYNGKPEALRGTFDNGATTSELRFLARAFGATKDPRYQAAFLRGLDHILKAQYRNGGWPQYYPPGDDYHRYVTFNDHSMVRILEFLRDVAESSHYEFVADERRLAARNAFVRGIQCILDAQIVVNGNRTVWCAQHDEIDLRPRPARAYELESLSGAESAAILKLLMSIPNPSPEIQRAIRAGAAWYDSAKITGIRLQKTERDQVVVEDPNGPPLWARFYEIETNRPLFCGRDGIRKYRLAEIEAERRRGYAWYGKWGEEVAAAYEQWQKRWTQQD